MRRRWLAGVVMALTIVLVCAGRGSATYVLDDGTGENAVGLRSGGGDLIWLNQFDVLPPFSLITSISIAFGFGGAFPPDGTSVTVALWKDPDNDGNPADAILLTTLAGVTANTGTDIFNVYDIADTLVSGKFFAGAMITIADSEFPARIDMTTSAGQSWLAFGAGSGLANLPFGDFLGRIDDLRIPGNWMIRADGAEPAAVPEPASLILAGLGTLGLLGYHWRRKRSG